MASNQDRAYFNKLWDSAIESYGDDLYSEIYEMLLDDRFDVAKIGNGFGLERMIREQCEWNPYLPKFKKCIYQYLVRLRKDYPEIYATTAGRYPFSEFISHVEAGRDPEGFISLLPKYLGSYDRLHRQKFERKVNE